MKSSDGMTALGTYAVSGLKTKPATGDYEAGVVAGQDLPEAWWNYFLNAFSSNEDLAKASIANILAELTTVLASSGLTPDNATTTQVDAALKAKYMSRLGTVVTDFNALVTSSLPQGSVTSFYTDTGYTNGPAGATVQTGFILRSKVAADSCILIAFGNVTAIGVSNYPVYFRVRSSGTWLAWTSLLGGNNAASAATASALVLRDSSGRAKMVAPAAADDIARKDTVTADIATHQAVDLAHQATPAATASKIMARDSSGRAKVAAPSAEDDIARLDTVQNQSVAPHAIVRLTSGSGNWTVPAGVTRIKVTCVGGGGGGGGAGTNTGYTGTDGGTGGTTSFTGATSGTGGGGGKAGGGSGSYGGGVGAGGGAGSAGGAGSTISGCGGSGGGAGGFGIKNGTGSDGSYGGGGGGAGNTAGNAAGGGGGTIISSVTASILSVTPNSAIAYSVGAGGTAGGGGNLAGGAGGSGIIIIEY